jgi:hypothetical protein
MPPRPFASDLQPWERQPDETEGAFYAFNLYRSQGRRRSLLKVTQALWVANGSKGPEPKVSWGHINGWSSEWRWMERCALYANHLEKQKLQVMEGRRQARIQQWIESFELMHDIGHYSLQVMSGRAPAPADDDPTARLILKSSDLPKWLETALRAEFDLRGNPGAMLQAIEEAEAIEDGIGESTAETPEEAEALFEAGEAYILRVDAIKRQAKGG